MLKKAITSLLVTLGFCSALHAEDAAKGVLVDVILTASEGSKIGAIKAVREISWMGLAQAKNLIETLPHPLLEGATKDEADAAVKRLEAAKCKTEVSASKVTSAERYDVVLKSFDPLVKSQIVAMIQNANGLADGDGDKIVAALPAIVKKRIPKSEADRMKASFEYSNAVVEVKDSGK